MKIGIFGGSFNPPHNAHLEICRYVHAQMHFDKIILIPTGDNPLKKTDEETGRAHRLNMTRLMCEGAGWMEVSDIEISRTGKSYTVDTLRALKKDGCDEYWFIVGADILPHFTSWRDFGLLCRMVRFISVMRGGIGMKEALNAAHALSEKFGAAVTVFDYEPTDISSSLVRELAAEGKDFAALIPENVYAYIEKNGLYGNKRHV
jgi:nicotinate-nucleotide adenylyltransferase